MPSNVESPLLLAGLGNPGGEYARNRHNAGFMAADTIHASYKFGPWRSRFHGVVSEGALSGRKTYLLKPTTFMNESGHVSIFVECKAQPNIFYINNIY